MATGLWPNNDGLVIQFGTQKANPAVGGEYLSYGDTREVEVTINLANLTTTANIVELTTLFPTGTGIFIEEVTYNTEVGMVVASGATAISVGLGYVAAGAAVTTVGNLQLPTVTTISDTAFVNGALNATFTTAGQRTTMVTGTTGAGAYIGSTSAATTQANYITAKSVGGTYSSGTVKVRIRYRGIGPITQ